MRAETVAMEGLQVKVHMLAFLRLLGGGGGAGRVSARREGRPGWGGRWGCAGEELTSPLRLQLIWTQFPQHSHTGQRQQVDIVEGDGKSSLDRKSTRLNSSH